jgi:hypothetical protein
MASKFSLWLLTKDKDPDLAFSKLRLLTDSLNWGFLRNNISKTFQIEMVKTSRGFDEVETGDGEKVSRAKFLWTYGINLISMPFSAEKCLVEEPNNSFFIFISDEFVREEGLSPTQRYNILFFPSDAVFYSKHPADEVIFSKIEKISDIKKVDKKSHSIIYTLTSSKKKKS